MKFMDPPTPPVRIGRVAAGPGFSVAEVDYAAGWRQPPHAHESTGVTLVLAGGFRETAFGRDESASSLSVVVKPAGVVHADEIGREGARTVLVEIKDPALLPEGLKVMEAWGFRYSAVAFTWVKLKRSFNALQLRVLPTLESDLHVGLGWTTRKNAEFCLLGRRGNARRNAKDVRFLDI